MIRCFTGLPGSGKSNALVDIAHKALKGGRKVYSNIAIKGCNKIEFTDLIEYRFPRGAVILLDEAGRSFNSRDFKHLPPEIFDLFTLHRHLDLDMYIAVQDFGMIDINLRRVIELTYWVINYPILPFYIHHGYYSLEKLGVMKNPDFKRIMWKSRRVRQRYDTRSMQVVFKGKEELPDNPWFPFQFKYKSRIATLVQRLRIKFKRWHYDRKYQKKLLKQIEDGF
jgi:hypothetical protein